MKNTISTITIAAILCLFAGCKKDDTHPSAAAVRTTLPDTATLYVMIDSKHCSTPQSEYTSASVDIRGIKVFYTDHGWIDLTPVPGAWDLVSLQTAPVPVAEITENSKVFAGAITKIMLTVGDNNKLVVDNKAANCFKIGTKEIMIDLQGNIQANALNELVLSVDICGKFTVVSKYQEETCYTLTPAFAFQSLVQR
jgi:hypothetical protein